MKKYIVLGWLALALAVYLPAMAQKKGEQEEKLARRFDSTLIRLGRINTKQSKEVKQVAETPVSPQQVFDATLPVVNNDAETTRQQLEAKKAIYLPRPAAQQQIDKDVLPLLAAVPEPISALPQAKQEIRMSTNDNLYTRYIERVKQIRDGLAERARQEMTAHAKTEAQWKAEATQNQKDAENMLASNPAIQEMGGLEKLKNMTPEQRAALGKQMAEKMKQNPSGYTAQQKPVTPASREADLAKRDKTLASMAIDKRIALIMEHSKEMTTIAGNLQQRTDSYFDGVYKKLSAEYAARIAALPMVEMGEYGHDKDTYATDLAYNIVLYPIEKQQAVSNKQVWNRFLQIMKITIAEYNDLLSEFSGEAQLMTEKGLTPAGVSASLCDGLIHIAEMAKIQTARNASQQRTFDEKVLHIYE